MGRRLQGAKLRAKKRSREAENEIVETAAAKVDSLEDAADADLFVIDTTATKMKVLTQKEAMRVKKEKQSMANHSKVQKLVETHTAEELAAMVQQSRPEQIRRAKRRKRETNYDLWAKEEPSVPTNIGSAMAGTATNHVVVKAEKCSAPTASSLPVQVAHGGQSYHPDPTLHKTVIQTAVDIEVRRTKAQNYNKTPIGQGLSAETRALLLGDDSSSSESESEEPEEKAPIKPTKRTEKLTRAQRNKQKRHRALQAELRRKKQEKKLLNSYGQAKSVAKALRKQEEERQKRKATPKPQARTLGSNVIETISKENPIEAPTLPVALSEELGSSLRTMKPKGSLVEDRMESFVDRKMAFKKKAGDKKRIVQGKRRKKVRGAVDAYGMVLAK